MPRGTMASLGLPAILQRRSQRDVGDRSPRWTLGVKTFHDTVVFLPFFRGSSVGFRAFFMDFVGFSCVFPWISHVSLPPELGPMPLPCLRTCSEELETWTALESERRLKVVESPAQRHNGVLDFEHLFSQFFVQVSLRERTLQKAASKLLNAQLFEGERQTFHET